ncbi:SMC-Scp complex subunit ScpB [Aciduricibacillus chroicocephali]|uniref:Segregation and condensation protein B n=1 Tax=Aciduricibacillus chroicocephali TaxID=3054939 RepID=A0ABY9KYT4_9BACI|nr:SMC-Scp complex subunit ScpB [Bacillaceae bacterium 44XB]
MDAAVEALLFASGDEGVTLRQIQSILSIKPDQAGESLSRLSERYSKDQSGLAIMKSGDVYFFATKPEMASYCRKLFETAQPARLSQASLETLAIIAYRQPITKTEIEEIRGVKSDRPIHTLMQRELIEEAGRKETIGRPILFRTSKLFLISFGLTSLMELPPLELPDDGKEKTEADLFFRTLQKEQEH